MSREYQVLRPQEYCNNNRKTQLDYNIIRHVLNFRTETSIILFSVLKKDMHIYFCLIYLNFTRLKRTAFLGN